jgi:hypothetical protein
MSSIESIVTQLLVTTKLLLEGLTNWSKRRMTEKEVSDIYVKLGSELNTVVHIFGQSGIDMRLEKLFFFIIFKLEIGTYHQNIKNPLFYRSDLINIPQDLRVCLETALSEEASPSALEAHLPKIRDIIVNLLQGLKAKQSAYRQLHGGYDQPPQISMPIPQNMTRSISARSNSTSPKMVTQQGLTPQSNIRRNVSSPSRINTGGSQSSDPMDALKHSDNLERRASKRFSAYTMQRGGHTRARSNLRNQETLKPPSPEPTAPEPTKDCGREESEDENNSVSPQPETPLSETREEKVPTEENLNVDVPSINIEGIH